ncbi:hypothetical protein ACTOB_005820 [Actinoplanes oblitus]|uniref:DUF3995 domain-containing protein n=1 Tax=Actinoplanes oblitus TaxID=3040509 RepID=A0ABY8W9R8_9ACTN|nr:hypothetical protein [Actinoplanes oblitus]WIM93828.1 hypothetical protein ACTOB_005820 [Actinoplanes oblitus]
MTNTAQKVAAGWAAGYGTLALGWAVTGHGFPFGPGDPRNSASPLRALDASVGAPLFAGVLLATALALLAMAGTDRPSRFTRIALAGYLWLVVAALLFVVVDVRALTFAGYLPMLIGGLPFGWPPVDYGAIFTWALANEVIAIAGGVLIARAVVRWLRRTENACESCGRTAVGGGWTEPEAARRWGRVAAYVAAVIPALYAAVRIAWGLGIPLGISPAFLADMHRTGLVWAGVGLASFALVGSVLTIGLTRRWGEVLFGWRVPIRLATIPAGLVAIFVMSASVSLFTGDGSAKLFTGEDRAAVLPMLLWPLWSVALGLAAYGYHLRRRPPCEDGDQGVDSPAGLVPGSRAGAY